MKGSALVSCMPDTPVASGKSGYRRKRTPYYKKHNGGARKTDAGSSREVGG
jgi:hypothetical protein